MERPFGFTRDRIEISMLAYDSRRDVVDRLIRDLWRHARDESTGIAFLYPSTLFRDMAAGAFRIMMFGGETADVISFVKMITALRAYDAASYEEWGVVIGRIGAIGRVDGEAVSWGDLVHVARAISGGESLTSEESDTMSLMVRAIRAN